jgi:hypothetical protein
LLLETAPHSLELMMGVLLEMEDFVTIKIALLKEW